MEVARRLLALGKNTVDEVAQVTGLDIEVVKGTGKEHDGVRDGHTGG